MQSLENDVNWIQVQKESFKATERNVEDKTN